MKPSRRVLTLQVLLDVHGEIVQIFLKKVKLFFFEKEKENRWRIHRGDAEMGVTGIERE